MKRGVVLVWLFITFIVAAANHRDRSAFNLKDFEDSGFHESLFSAIHVGQINFSLDSDDPEEQQAFEREIRIALSVWTLKIGLPKVRLKKIPLSDRSDIHFSLRKNLKLKDENGWKKSLGFFTSLNKNGLSKPLIILRSGASSTDKRKVVLSLNAQQEGYIIPQKNHPSLSLLSYLGDDASEIEVSKRIISTKCRFKKGEIIRDLEGRNAVLGLSVLIHELGHALGLADLYKAARDGFNEPRYKSVMKYDHWQSIVPSYLDVKRVKTLYLKMKKCEFELF